MTRELLPQIHLGQLLRTGEDAHIDGELTKLEYEQDGKQTLSFEAPAPYAISVNTIGGNDMYLQGFFRPTLHMDCARCLRDVPVLLELSLGVVLRYDPSVEKPYLEEAESGEELLMFGEPLLDLSDYLAETTLMSAPLVVLHDPDCKGLCQECGQDLNEGQCECNAPVPTLAPDQAAASSSLSPFAALKDLELPNE